METTDKEYARILTHLLIEHGVKNVILCPGSRNTPMIIDISRCEEIESFTVIDERSAAFMALGMALESGRPVATVCTSGSAILNMAPAAAEAYYRQIPLILISADRPAEWIDQDDSQTIRQYGVLANVVKGSWDVPVETGSKTQSWYVSRIINDAIDKACQPPYGPVHINIQFETPLGHLSEQDYITPKVIHHHHLEKNSHPVIYWEKYLTEKTLIIAGFMPPNQKTTEALEKLAELPNVVVLTEAQANIYSQSPLFIRNIDSILSSLNNHEKDALSPSLVITLGGSLVSRFIKQWIRKCKCDHWHIGYQDCSVDCFQKLTERISMPTDLFLSSLLKENHNIQSSNYSKDWSAAYQKSKSLDENYKNLCKWSDYKAMQFLIDHTPSSWHLHLSNGTAIRYAQLFDYTHIERIDCNRGVSGIDGCTSTAIGASIVFSNAPTLLITGDMSAQYDMGAFASSIIPSRFKMAVLNNMGGGIFRFIESTASIPEREKYFCGDVRLPLKELAQAFGFEYFEASDEDSLLKYWPLFVETNRKPCIFNILTDPIFSAKALQQYFNLRN